MRNRKEGFMFGKFKDNVNESVCEFSYNRYFPNEVIVWKSGEGTGILIDDFLALADEIREKTRPEVCSECGAEKGRVWGDVV